MKIRISPLPLFLYGALLWEDPVFCGGLLLATALHEGGHLLGAHFAKIPLQELRLDLLGARITPASSLYSYGAEALLCLSGPLANFLTLTLLALLPSETPFLLSLKNASLGLGVMNSLPIKTFDGGRMLRALSHAMNAPALLFSVLSLLSFLTLFSLWSLSIYLLLRTGASLSLFFFSIFLFAEFYLTPNEKNSKKVHKDGLPRKKEDS